MMLAADTSFECTSKLSASAIKVRQEARTKCSADIPPGHHSDFVSHDGHAMQGRLAVEQGYVSIHQMALHNVPTLEL